MKNSVKIKGRLSAGTITIVMVTLLLSSVIATTTNAGKLLNEAAAAKSYERDRAIQRDMTVMRDGPSAPVDNTASTTGQPDANPNKEMVDSPAAVSNSLESGPSQHKEDLIDSTQTTRSPVKVDTKSSLATYDIMPSIISQDDGNFAAQAALASPIVAPSTNIVNVKATYDIAFRTATAGAIKSVEIQFPAGTNLGVLSKVDVSGLGTGVLSIAGTTLTYIVTSAVNVPANTQVNFVIGNLVNPASPVNTPLIVTITTKDSGGTVIDGPTPTNSYNLRNINTAELANDAVTLPKIQSGIVVTGTDTLQTVTTFVPVPPNTQVNVIAECPPDYVTVGGGFGSTNNGDMVIIAEGRVFPPNDPEGWRVTAFNFGATNVPEVQAAAECQTAFFNP